MGCLGSGGLVSALTYQTSQNVEFTFNPTISVSLSSNDLIIDNLTPNSSSDSNIITVSVSTNTGYGYYMSATAGTSTGDTNLTSTTNSGNVFTNLSSNAATLAAFPDDRWGYSYSTDDGSTWISGSQGSTTSGYNGLPLDNDDSGATGVILASTDSFSNSGSVKFKIGAKASATQATGTYTNTVNFYAVANPEPQLGPESCNPRKICYHANALTTVEGTMGEQSKDDSNANISDGATVTLLASNFSRTGYGFAGWSDAYDYSGNFYGPSETITVPNGTTTNGLSLYAIWIRSEGSIQDSTKVSQICNHLSQSGPSIPKTLNSVSALTDQRDGETYAIARLADGNCWMIENLRLENTAAHNADGSLAQGYNTNFIGLAEPEDSNFADSTVANSLYTVQTGVEGKIVIEDYDRGYRFPRYNNTNAQNRASGITTNNANVYSYGNYYTWPAAIANTTRYDRGEDNGEPNKSICPTGWRLPRGGRSTVTDYGILDVAMGGTGETQNSSEASNRWREYPNNYLYSGIISSSSIALRGTNGEYWSISNGYSNSEALMLSFGNNKLSLTRNGNYKYYGLSVRCMTSPGA